MKKKLKTQHQIDGMCHLFFNIIKEISTLWFYREKSIQGIWIKLLLRKLEILREKS